MTADAAGVAPVEYRHVLVPLDGSAFAAAALPTGRALAGRFGASLVTLSAARDERESERLRTLVTDLVGPGADPRAIHVEIAPDPVAAIHAHAEELEPCVVCMSTRGRGRVSGALIGSVARGVLQSTRAPVVAVGPRGDRPGRLVGRPPRRPRSWRDPLSVGDIVVAVDGSPESESALPIALRWAAALELPVTILTVADESAATMGTARRNSLGPFDPQGYVSQLSRRWGEGSVDVVGEVVSDPIGVGSGVSARLARQPAALMVVTTRARSGLERLRLGSGAAGIVRTSTAPVLVVPLVADAST